MIEVKKSAVKYLDREGIEIIHNILSRQFSVDGEPIPPIAGNHTKDIDSLVATPQLSFCGVELYPTIESKAAIIFYTINKKHIFTNGNKRMSVACMLIFLSINGIDFVASNDDLTEKALWLAKTTHTDDFQEVKTDLEVWIKNNLK